MFELRIHNERCSFEPQVRDEVLYESYHRGRCSKLSFEILSGGQSSQMFSIREGDSVSLRIDGKDVFWGVIFQRRTGFDGIESIVAYDQLRYLKNRDTYIYWDKSASDVVRMIALDYQLRLGVIEPTHYVIPYRVEDNVTLDDIIENALDFELERSGRRFTLIDEFGRLSLKSEAQMLSGVILDKDVVGSYRFFSSIEGRNNRIKISRYDNSSGTRDIAVANDPDSELKIGILQHYIKTSDNDESLHQKAHSILRLRNKDERSIIIKDAIGDTRVRGGSKVALDLGGYKGDAIVLNCSHRLAENRHLMNLTVGGV